MAKREFTPASANKTLPLVRRIVQDIQAKGGELRALARGGGGKDGARLEELEAEVEELMRELSAIGCSYKDGTFEVGLVDFPGTIGGKPVFLCWRSDEDRVTWYHPRDEGYAGRRRIPAQELQGSG